MSVDEVERLIVAALEVAAATRPNIAAVTPMSGRPSMYAEPMAGGAGRLRRQWGVPAAVRAGRPAGRAETSALVSVSGGRPVKVHPFESWALAALADSSDVQAVDYLPSGDAGLRIRLVDGTYVEARALRLSPPSGDGDEPNLRAPSP